MRIAICFFGQPRTFEFCYGLNREYYEELQKDNSVDFFIHTWKNNTGGLGSEINQGLGFNTLREKLSTLYVPKKLVIEDAEYVKYAVFPKSTVDTSDRFFCMQYSMSKTLQLCRKYEKQENFRYDQVMLLRMDQWFPKGFILASNPENIAGKREIISIQDIPFPENYNTVDGRNVFCTRDEGFQFNSETAEIFSHLCSWLLTKYNYGFYVGAPMHFNELWAPEASISRFVLDQKLHFNPAKGIVHGRLIVRQPLETLLSPKNQFHLQLLYEIREWVDYVTKEEKAYTSYVKGRLAGRSAKDCLEELQRWYDLDFLSTFVDYLKFGDVISEEIERGLLQEIRRGHENSAVFV